MSRTTNNRQRLIRAEYARVLRERLHQAMMYVFTAKPIKLFKEKK